MDYPDLSRVIAERTNGNIQVPDFRDRYARYSNGNAIGQHVDDTMQYMYGKVWHESMVSYGANLVFNGPIGRQRSGASWRRMEGGSYGGLYAIFDNSRAARTSNENRPKTVYVQAVIKILN